jgi:hypothetical protein
MTQAVASTLLTPADTRAHVLEIERMISAAVQAIASHDHVPSALWIYPVIRAMGLAVEACESESLIQSMLV